MAQRRLESAFNDGVEIMIGRDLAAVAAASHVVPGGCETQASRSFRVDRVSSAAAPYGGVRRPVLVGTFDNRSNVIRSVFSDGDRPGSRAKGTLSSHSQQSQRFSVLDRDNMAETSQEAKLQRTQQTLEGASSVVTGDIAEPGRKEVGIANQRIGTPRKNGVLPGPRSPLYGRPPVPQ